ncbi:MAG: hypothetical protein ACM336_11420 [Acidobacteriota bacterium]
MRFLVTFACLLAAADALFAGQTRIRAIDYPARAAAMPAMPCEYARDLPLIALMGANTVRTYGLLPEGHGAFLRVLDSTRLNWLAGFPVEDFPDTPRALDAFRAYALRLRGTKRLTGYVFSKKNAALVAAAAEILRELEPERTPMLGIATRDAGDLASDVPGLSFWIWSGRGLRKASRPLLIATTAAGADDTEATEGALGGVYGSFAEAGDGGVFRSSPTEFAGYETLTPMPVYYTLAGLWGGTFPEAWTEKRAPLLASPDGPTSAGALVRLPGGALATAAAPYADESWPYHLAETCLCVAGAPARLGFVSASQITAQIPPSAEPGSPPLVLYRAGQASNFVRIHVSEFSAGGFAGAVLEARMSLPAVDNRRLHEAVSDIEGRFHVDRQAGIVQPDGYLQEQSVVVAENTTGGNVAVERDSRNLAAGRRLHIEHAIVCAKFAARRAGLLGGCMNREQGPGELALRHGSARPNQEVAVDPKDLDAVASRRVEGEFPVVRAFRSPGAGARVGLAGQIRAEVGARNVRAARFRRGSSCADSGQDQDQTA